MRGPGGPGPPSPSPQVPPRALQRNSGVPREGAGKSRFCVESASWQPDKFFFARARSRLAIPVGGTVGHSV